MRQNQAVRLLWSDDKAGWWKMWKQMATSPLALLEASAVALVCVRNNGNAPQGTAPEVGAILVPLLSKREPSLSQNETAEAQRSQATCSVRAGAIREKRRHLGRVSPRPPPSLGRADRTPRGDRALLWHTSCSYPCQGSCAALSSAHGGMAMARHRHSALLVGTTLVSLLLLLGPSTASVVTKTLAQTPVTGRLGAPFTGG